MTFSQYMNFRFMEGMFGISIGLIVAGVYGLVLWFSPSGWQRARALKKKEKQLDLKISRLTQDQRSEAARMFPDLIGIERPCSLTVPPELIYRTYIKHMEKKGTRGFSCKRTDSPKE